MTRDEMIGKLISVVPIASIRDLWALDTLSLETLLDATQRKIRAQVIIDEILNRAKGVPE